MIKQTLRNQKGILTLDFIFASTLILGLSTIIFSFGMTLSIMEVVQYISYASARNYSLAHLNETKQRERGEFKFQELSGHGSFAPMMNISWFELGAVVMSDFNGEYDADPAVDSDTFIGSRIPLKAPILYKRIPLVGKTADDPDQFQVNLNSFLAREPTFSECQAFMSQRAQQFMNLGANYQLDSQQVAIIMDNGC